MRNLCIVSTRIINRTMRRKHTKAISKTPHRHDQSHTNVVSRCLDHPVYRCVSTMGIKCSKASDDLITIYTIRGIIHQEPYFRDKQHERSPEPRQKTRTSVPNYAGDLAFPQVAAAHRGNHTQFVKCPRLSVISCEGIAASPTLFGISENALAVNVIQSAGSCFCI